MLLNAAGASVCSRSMIVLRLRARSLHETLVATRGASVPEARREETRSSTDLVRSARIVSTVPFGPCSPMILDHNWSGVNRRGSVSGQWRSKAVRARRAIFWPSNCSIACRRHASSSGRPVVATAVVSQFIAKAKPKEDAHGFRPVSLRP